MQKAGTSIRRSQSPNDCTVEHCVRGWYQCGGSWSSAVEFRGGLEKQIASLVHPNVLPHQAERMRHETFMLRRLASSLAIVCLAPLFLAIYGAPAVWHALVFVWCIVPIGAVLLLSRSGDLLLAQTICVLSFIGAATTIAAGGGPWEAALIWLVLAPFEGVLSQSFRLVLAAGALAVLAALGLTLADDIGLLPTGFSAGAAPLLVLPAILYATLIAHGLVAFQMRCERGRACAPNIIAPSTTRLAISSSIKTAMARPNSSARIATNSSACRAPT